MNKSWEQETAEMLEKINEETEKLLTSNLPRDEFHKKYQEIIDFWNETSKRVQQNHPLNHKPKARPKYAHHSHHMSDKYHLEKMFRKLYEKR